MKPHLAENGLDNWRNISQKLRIHERSSEYKLNFVKWVNLHKDLKLEATVDKKRQEQIENEKMYWRKMLTRIIAVVKTLSCRGLPFRGINDKHYEKKKNGLFANLLNFLRSLIQLCKSMFVE